MLLGGLWHGAGWNFMAWGDLHGVALAVNHLSSKRGLTMPAIVASPLTLLTGVPGSRLALHRHHRCVITRLSNPGEG